MRSDDYAHSINHNDLSVIKCEDGLFAVIVWWPDAGSTLTSQKIRQHLAEKTELPNKTAAAFLEQLADTAIKETKKNGIFVVPGLGRLVKAHRKARVGRNPQTGEPIQIKAKTVVKFRVAKAAKDAIAPKK